MKPKRCRIWPGEVRCAASAKGVAHAPRKMQLTISRGEFSVMSATPDYYAFSSRVLARMHRADRQSATNKYLPLKG